MGRKRSAKSTESGSPVSKLISSNPVLLTLHNKWRYWNRKFDNVKLIDLSGELRDFLSLTHSTTSIFPCI